MDDIIKVIVSDINNTANAIKKDTDALRGRTDNQIGWIDDTSKNLPAPAYNGLLPMLGDIKAYLHRSMDIRDRISTVLAEVAQVVQKQDQNIAHHFNQATSQMSQTNNPK
ncbi:MAG TPA: hypothetical protein VKY19_17980 [Ktedonosporobacter sp.]|jgi:hypothetical protein|nr:hypothetical protein [Ktedonosporobacter sp.]